MSCGDGSDSKRFLPPKTVAWELVFGTVATQQVSWEVLARTATSSSMNRLTRKTLHGNYVAFTDCNEQSTLPALPPVNGKEAISYNEDKRK